MTSLNEFLAEFLPQFAENTIRVIGLDGASSSTVDSDTSSCRETGNTEDVSEHPIYDDIAGSDTQLPGTYQFDGRYYTLDELTVLCEQLTGELNSLFEERSGYGDIVQTEEMSDAELAGYNRILNDINFVQPRKDMVCSLVEQIRAELAAQQAAEEAERRNNSFPPDLTEEEALSDLDAALRDLSYGSSLGVNIDNYIAFGRRALILNLSDYGGQTSDLNNHFSLENPIIIDRLKYFYNSFYSLENNNELVLYRNNSEIQYLSIKEVVDQTVLSSDVGNSGFDLPVLKDRINFILKQGLQPAGYVSGEIIKVRDAFVSGLTYDKKINGQQKYPITFKTLINRIILNSFYSDDSFRMTLPFENSELLENISLYGTSIVDIKAEYNFYIKEYEKIAKNSNLYSVETSLPNLYVLASETPSANSQQLSINLANSYFDQFGMEYTNSRIQNLDLFRTNENKNKNVIFLSDSIKKLGETNKKKYQFPMFVEFSIPTDKSSNILKMIYNSGLIDNFITKLSELYNSGSFVEKDSVFSEKILDQNLNINQVNTIQNPVNSSHSSKRIKTKEIELKEIMNEIMSDSITQSTINNNVFVGDTSIFSNMNSSSMRFSNSIRRIIFQGQLMTFLKNNSRNYIDILRGKTCYNETLAYRIAKYELNGTEPIQNFWISNDDSLEKLNIIDTQIKYEKEYNYKIYAYQAVIGTNYAHYDNERRNFSEFISSVAWQTNPKIIEVELLSVNRRVSDSPPLSPEIEFIPYFGIDNKIGLFLSTRVGREKLEVINVLDSDSDKTSIYLKDSNNLVTYETDDLSKRYEVMRLDKKPRNYSDFKNGIIKVAEYDFDPDDPSEEIVSASIVDDIIPNKKYYYCFRCVDIHDNISNPTSVYEIEMVNENGMIFPIVKKHEFEQPKFENSKQMRRFIKIKPQIKHYLLDTQAQEIISSTSATEALQRNLKLGLDSASSPWDQTFKMVATSKQTGRKIEIKFKFKYRIE